MREVAKSLAVNAIILTILLVGAGRPGWLAAWVCTGIMGALQMAVILVVYRRTPDLAVERSKIQKGTKQWDKYLVAGAAVIAPLAMFLEAALDRRYGWSAPLPLWIRLGGFFAAVGGGALTFSAMYANRFFANTVRIQTERGHIVVDAGPYAYLRHPGYTGMIAFNLGVPLLLGSWWALLPAGAAAALFVLRTALEDRTLQKELPGYKEYAVRVRKRLVPFVS
jgi:protein-S-isoprenylcysteine O-methyltransferase Ste14